MKKVYNDLSQYTKEIETLPYIWQYDNLEQALKDLEGIKKQLPSWVTKEIADFKSAVVAFKGIDETNSKELEELVYKAVDGYDTERNLTGVRISVKMSFMDNTETTLRLYYLAVPFYRFETKYDTTPMSISDIRYHGRQDPYKIKVCYQNWTWITEDKKYYDSIYKESSVETIHKLLARALTIKHLKDTK